MTKELHAFTLQVAERLYLAACVLANRAEKRPKEPDMPQFDLRSIWIKRLRQTMPRTARDFAAMTMEQLADEVGKEAERREEEEDDVDIGGES